MEIKIPPYVLEVLGRLENGGFEAWCVGGCVRDPILGLSPADWDVTTSATPEEAEKCFSGLAVLETGKMHGTVTVLTEGGAVDVTAYRRDGAYLDHRRPAHVRFSRRLEDDLSRRDFTVNALAYHPRRGLRDLFGGLEDLEARTLRCVGEPDRRFEEDALRILRCLRFSATLGFSIESETGRALREKRALLSEVSGERVREELTKLLCGRQAAEILREYAEVAFTALPELAPMQKCEQETPYHRFNVWEHTLHAVEAARPEPILRWAALLHDCGKPEVKSYGPDGAAHFYAHEKRSVEIAGEILERLRFSNREREEITSLIRRHGEPAPLPEKRVKRLLAELGEEGFFRLLELKRADVSAQAAHLHDERVAAIEASESLARDVLSREECLSLRDLAINGGDLLALGFSEGPEVGRALRALLEQVLDGTLENRREALLKRAEEGKK